MPWPGYHRVATKERTLSTIMHSYTVAHTLPPHLLQDRGLHGPIVQADTGSHRFLTLEEGRRLFALPQSFRLLFDDACSAWAALGNSIPLTMTVLTPTRLHALLFAVRPRHLEEADATPQPPPQPEEMQASVLRYIFQS